MTQGKPVDWQLAIDTPLAGDALDTSRMLVMPTPGALETYKGGRWADTPPLVLRGLLIEAFQQTGRIAGVGAITSGLHADYTMTIDLYDFEVQYRDGAPHAVIRLNEMKTRRSSLTACAPRKRSRPTSRFPARRRRCRGGVRAGAERAPAAYRRRGRSIRAMRSG